MFPASVFHSIFVASQSFHLHCKWHHSKSRFVAHFNRFNRRSSPLRESCLTLFYVRNVGNSELNICKLNQSLKNTITPTKELKLFHHVHIFSSFAFTAF